MSEPTSAAPASLPKQLLAADKTSSRASVTGLTLEYANPVQMFVGLVLKRRPLRSLLLVLTGAAGIGLMGFEPLLLKQLFDLLQSRSTNGIAAGGYSGISAAAHRDEALRLFGWIGAVWLASFAMNRLREWIEVYTAPEVRHEIQEHLLQWAMGHSAGFFRQRFAGALAQSIKQAGTAMAVLVTLVFNDFVRLIVTTALTLLLAARLEGGFVWAMAAWMLGYYALCLWFARKTAPMFKRFTTAGATSTGTLVDILTNIDLVRSFATQRREQAVASADLSVERDTSQENRRYILFMNAILQGGVLLFQIGFIAYAIHLFGLGLLTLGDVALMISLAAIVVANVNGLCGQLLNFFEQVGSFSSALTSILQPHDIPENKNALTLNAHSGTIRFERVSFSYQENQPVLQAFDLEIRPGEKVGLVGPSGSGKSTLLKLLTRQYNLAGGRILIDGQDISQVTLASLNLAVAEIPQDSTMFHRSLRDNIAYASPAIDDEQLVTAIEQSQSRAFIEERAEGLAAVVGERGTHLSGGERQRIAVARAILKDAPILVMDEATSALDSHTETLITTAIAKVIEGRTVIAIAHRLSTLTAMDRIVYLQNGTIVEQGSHTELLTKDGYYARMWRQQSSGFIAH